MIIVVIIITIIIIIIIILLPFTVNTMIQCAEGLYWYSLQSDKHAASVIIKDKWQHLLVCSNVIVGNVPASPRRKYLQIESQQTLPQKVMNSSSSTRILICLKTEIFSAFEKIRVHNTKTLNR